MHISVFVHMCPFLVFIVYWILRGSIDQIYKLLIKTNNNKKKPAKVLDAPRGRHHKNALFVFKPQSILLEHDVMSQIKTLRNTAGENKPTLYIAWNMLWLSDAL